MSEFFRSGRNPFERVLLEYDQCDKVYGVTCNAVLGQTGERKCFNTLKTCQDRASFALVATPLQITFCSNQAQTLSDVYAIPSLVNVSVSPARLNPAGGGSLSSLGSRSTITVTFQDHNHTDRIVDPYVDERKTGAAQADGVGYDPYDSGTFWGKLRARQEYLTNREIVYSSGYFLNGVTVENEVQTFFITGFAGPDASGKVTISGIDPLGLIKNDQAQAPAKSTGSVLADFTDVATSMTLTPAGVGNAKYPASGKVRIDKEIISFTRSGDVLTLTRGQNFTTPEAHKAGALVQLCLVITAQDAADIAYLLLVTYGLIPASLIDKPAWDAEIAAHATRLYDAVISDPVGVATLMQEVTEQMGIYIWYDGRLNTIKLRAVRPADSSTIYEFNDDNHIIEDSFSAKDDTSKLTTQVWVAFAQRDPTKSLTDVSNYSASEVSADLSAEGDTQARGSWVRQIFSRWIPGAGAATAVELAERILAQQKRPLKSATFSIDAKDRAISMGDFVRVRHRQVQDEIGRRASTLYQVLARPDQMTGTTIQLSVQEAPASSFVVDGEYQLIQSTNAVNVNLRTWYDTQGGPTPVSGDKIRFIIRPNVIIGGYAAGVYPTQIVAGALVGADENRGLYLGEIESNRFITTFAQVLDMSYYGSQFVRGQVYTGYMPAIQRRGLGASSFKTRGTSVSVGNRSAPTTAALQCDLLEIPTVPSIRTGTWPAGVILTLEIQSGAYIRGEGGAGACQYADNTSVIGTTTSNTSSAYLVYQHAKNILQGYGNRGVYGGDGGDAILAEHPITIINNGDIRCGGGGGAPCLGLINYDIPAVGDYYAAGWSRAGAGGQGYNGGESVVDGIADLASPNNVGHRGAYNAAGYTVQGESPKIGGTVVNSYGTAIVRAGSGGPVDNLFSGGPDGSSNSIYLFDGTNLLAGGLITSGGLGGRAVVGSSYVTWQTRGVVMGAEV